MLGTGITKPSEEYFKNGLWGWNGSAWVKLALLWGYTDVWRFVVSGTGGGTGTDTIETGAVPAGYVYVCTGLAVWHNSAAARNVSVAVNDGVGLYYFTGFPLAPANVWSGEVVDAALKEGEKLSATFLALAGGDSMGFRGVGYKMAVT